VQQADGGDLQRRREGIVGRLVEVDVIVGVDAEVLAAPAAEQLLGAVGDHLVDVHVERGAGAALQRVDDDLGQQRAVLDLAGGAMTASATSSARKPRR
jgi:hypothetical protein